MLRLRIFKLIIIATVLMPSLTTATDLVIGYAPYCYHFSGGANLNERNNHALLLSANQWFGLTFRNSMYNRSFAVGYEFRTKKWHPFSNQFYTRLTMPAGLLTGYRYSVTPAAVGVIETGVDNLSIKHMFLPVGGGVYSAMFCVDF